MTKLVRETLNSLEPGYARRIHKINETGPATYETVVNSKADRLVLFLSITSITGTCDVTVTTSPSPQDNVGEYPVVSFSQQTTPTTNYLRLVTPIMVSPFVVRTVITGSVEMALYAKAVNSVEAEGALEVSIGDKQTPVLDIINLTLINTWNTINLPTGCRDFEMIADPSSPARLDVRFSVGPEYWPVPPGNVYKEEFLGAGAVSSLEVRSPNKANVDVFMKYWLDS
jgi:hypothetical protein